MKSNVITLSSLTGQLAALWELKEGKRTGMSVDVRIVSVINNSLVECQDIFNETLKMYRHQPGNDLNPDVYSIIHLGEKQYEVVPQLMMF